MEFPTRTWRKCERGQATIGGTWVATWHRACPGSRRLRHSTEALREMVLGTQPRRIERSGHVATPAEYWQWFQELNKITVAGFEQELRALGFEPWRVALRPEPIIEYTPEILAYPMQDLATLELYTSWWNRK